MRRDHVAFARICRTSTNAASTVTVDYTVTGGTAVAGVDYLLANGKLSFLPGTSIQALNFSIINDSEIESDETLVVTLSGAVGAVFGKRGTFFMSGTLFNHSKCP